ncbi:hypothetical protein AWM68_03780 [Fictibacillus phosphorivorans]|uniref:Uncharacterized protein n=1 Tax=Fictibacillus phosphorivorans TaxID=1221500 RepID=A0A163SM58_9BACL|nr:hypothetical protein [Fictibacillus phosphorivorans]KZE69397.1 hypothetical protein AWM68_03780 [Fictibacillus phosphorivorans]
MKNPVFIYIILLFSMISFMLSIDWFMGMTPINVLRTSIFSFFRYVDKVEYALVVFLIFLPVVTFILSKWMEKKQNA